MPGWIKFVAGWVLTVVVALSLSWGAIAQVRNRVEQPGTVVLPSVLADADQSSDDAVSPVSTTPTLLTVEAEPSILEGRDTTSTSSGGGVDLGDDESPIQPQSGAPVSSEATTSTTSTPPPSTAAPSSSPTASSTTTTVTQATTTSSSTTTTSPPDEPSTQTETYVLDGGSVTIRFSPGIVTYVSAVPKGGYGTEVKDTGPDEVRVTFENEDHHSEFRAEWEGGELKVTTKENDED
ncbi:MAG: hypothetical protein M3092_00100 [Actinomycetia bacterium]|nr:hypothetical protein [Actinomycetes bacterium]